MNSLLRKLLPLGTLSLLALSATSQGALIFYEGFDYGATGGSLTALSDWSTASANDDSLYQASGLSYGALQTTGGAARSVTTWGNGDRNVTLDITDIDLTAKSEVWVSMLVQTPGAVSANSSANFGFRMVRNDWQNANTYTVGKAYSDQTANNSSFLGALPGATYAALGTDTFLVTYRFTSGSAGEVWVNPAIGGAAPLAGTGTSLTEGGNLTSITSLVLTYRGHDKIFDELRIGDTFADVTPVPEPGPAALAGLALLAVLGMRRRSRRVPA